MTLISKFVCVNCQKNTEISNVPVANEKRPKSLSENRIWIEGKAVRRYFAVRVVRLEIG